MAKMTRINKVTTEQTPAIIKISVGPSGLDNPPVFELPSPPVEEEPPIKKYT